MQDRRCALLEGGFDCAIAGSAQSNDQPRVLNGNTTAQQVAASPTQIALSSSSRVTSDNGGSAFQQTAFSSGLQRTGLTHDTGDLRLGHIGLILRQRDGRKNTDDRHHDHQLDKGKTLLHLSFHWILLRGLIGMRLKWP